MDVNNRFVDQNKTLADFYTEVWIRCSACDKQALATASFELKTASLYCKHCGFHKTKSIETVIAGVTGFLKLPAHEYFDAKLWLEVPFKRRVFWAYNPTHLSYLEAYIEAKLREQNERMFFTLLEKLPKFYHESKNRDSLLRLIKRLRKRNLNEYTC